MISWAINCVFTCRTGAANIFTVSTSTHVGCWIKMCRMLKSVRAVMVRFPIIWSWMQLFSRTTHNWNKKFFQNDNLYYFHIYIYLREFKSETLITWEFTTDRPPPRWKLVLSSQFKCMGDLFSLISNTNMQSFSTTTPRTTLKTKATLDDSITPGIRYKIIIKYRIESVFSQKENYNWSLGFFILISVYSSYYYIRSS